MTRYQHALAAALFGVIAAVVPAPPAFAHTGATVEPAVAGAPNATISFNAAAESSTAGITSLKIVLPQGIAPGDLTYVDGPAGWTLQPDAEGYVVSGPAVEVGRDVLHRVRVRQLPVVPVLVFKVLQTYNDGRVDRWIEVPSGANANPENPAPVVQLTAPPGGFPSGTASNAPTPASTDHGAGDASGTATDPPAPSTNSASDGDDAGSPLPWVVGGIVVGVAVLAAGLYARNRRRNTTSR